MSDVLSVTVRSDQTYDFRYLPPITADQVPGLLRQIADQVEQGVSIPNPDWYE